jgi:hypothetical protein
MRNTPLGSAQNCVEFVVVLKAREQPAAFGILPRSYEVDTSAIGLQFDLVMA